MTEKTKGRILYGIQITIISYILIVWTFKYVLMFKLWFNIIAYYMFSTTLYKLIRNLYITDKVNRKYE